MSLWSIGLSVRAAPQERIIAYTRADESETRLTFSTLFNSKLSNKSTLRAGALLENFQVQSLLRDRTEQGDTDGDGDPDFFTFRDIDENLVLFQPYVQGQFRLTEALTLSAGLHAQYSDLNEQFALEPQGRHRVPTRPKPQNKTWGTACTDNNCPLPILFLNEDVNGALLQTNKGLDFVRSNHFVAGL